MAEPFELVAVALIVMFVAVGMTLWRWRPRGADAPEPAPVLTESIEKPVGRNLRGLLFALVALPLSCWLALSIGWAFSDRPLPVKPPGPPSSCSGSSTDADLLLIVIGLLVLFQLGPSLAGFLLGRRKSRLGRPLPDGRWALRFGAVLVGVALVATAVRLVMGGVSPTAFDTYGALTPPGAKGWRAEQVIARHLADRASFTTITPGELLRSDMRQSGSCMSMGPYAVPGLKAWVGGAPVNIVHDGRGGFLVHDIAESTVDPARRPHFGTQPRIARGLGKGNWVLKSIQADGSIFAVSVYTVGQSQDVYLHGVDRRQVGLLLRPPAWPLPVGLALMLLVLFLIRLAGRLTATSPPGTAPSPPGTARGTAWAAAARLGAAFLLLEASLFLYGVYRLYF